MSWLFFMDESGHDHKSMTLEDGLVARAEIAADFGPKLNRLQWEGEGYRDGDTFKTKGIVLVADPYEQRPRTNKKGGKAPADLQ